MHVPHAWQRDLRSEFQKIICVTLHALTQSAPFILDIDCCAPECLRNKHITLADGSGKQLDMRSQTMSEGLIGFIGDRIIDAWTHGN